MKLGRWLALSLLLPAGNSWRVLRGPELAPAGIATPVKEAQTAAPEEEPPAATRRPIASSSQPALPAFAVPSSSIAAKVVDSSGSVVSGAEVWFSDGSIEELQGKSDAKGLIQCASAHWRSAVFERAFLTAYRDGFAPGNAALPIEPALQPIEIVLQPAWSVRGRVFGPLDSEVGAGFSVAVIRSDSAPNVQSFRVGKRGPAWICAEADAEGHFVLEGLDRSLSYQLVAWGPGFIPDGRSSAIVSFSSVADEQIARVTPIYGCRFKFSDATNRNVRTSPLLTVEGGLKFMRPPGFTSMAPSYPYLRLAQVPERLLVPRGPDSIPVLSMQDVESELVDSISGVGASLKLPGYELCYFDGEAPLARGACVEHEVTLTPSASGFGSIKIRFNNFPTISETDLRTFATTPLLGVVVLAAPAGASYAIEVKHDCAGVVAVDGVPAGNYRVWFRDTFEFFRSPEPGQESTHEVTAGHETELFFDLPPHGQIVLFTDDGVGPRGRSPSIELARTSEGSVVKAKYTPYFAHLPGALYFLPTGEYRIKSSSGLLGPERLGELRVEVASGKRIAVLASRTGP